MKRYYITNNPDGYPVLISKDGTASRPTNAELQFWQEREAYRKAFEAADAVLWMAARYAEGGLIESEDYTASSQAIHHALKPLEHYHRANETSRQHNET